jgi:hypothetical protein
MGPGEFILIKIPKTTYNTGKTVTKIIEEKNTSKNLFINLL